MTSPAESTFATGPRTVTAGGGQFEVGELYDDDGTQTHLILNGHWDDATTIGAMRAYIDDETDRMGGMTPYDRSDFPSADALWGNAMTRVSRGYGHEEKMDPEDSSDGDVYRWSAAPKDGYVPVTSKDVTYWWE
jgi:hypothetical protein